MKRILTLALLFLFPVLLYSEENVPIAPNLVDQDRNPGKVYPITIEYPYQGARIAANSNAIFILGKVTPATGTLTINGTKINLYKTGTWLAYLPVKRGRFDFIAEFNDGKKVYYARRSVVVYGYDYRNYEGQYRFDSDYIFPTSNLEATVTDAVEFSVVGSPGRKVKLTLGDNRRGIDMQESPTDKGLYKVTVTFDKGSFIRKPVRAGYAMYDDKGKMREQVFSNGTVRVVPLEEGIITARVLPEDLRMRPEAKPKDHILNTRLYGEVTLSGRMNNLFRVQLDPNNTGWIERKYINFLPHSNPPRNITWEVDAVSEKDKTVITLKNTERVSFKTDQTNNSFNITLFYTQAVNTALNKIDDKLVKSINYDVSSGASKKISLVYAPGQVLWGYRYKYDGNNLILELYHKPDLFFTDKLPLRGLKILLDPGHSPRRKASYDGAVGPGGLLEYEANYAIAKAAADKLREKGATVFMTRKEDEHMGLVERTQEIDEDGANMFISIHNNALPDNTDPFAKERGFAIYYYHPQDVTFAQSLERSYRYNVGLPSDGVLQADFAVIRNSPQVPSVLIENAFIIIPYQEDLLRQDKFINTLAKAITDGVIGYVNPSWAAKQKKH